MKNKNTYTIEASTLASDLAIQMSKARRILDKYQYDREMTEFGKGIQSSARQMIKWQVWTNPAFIPLIVRECRIARMLCPNSNN
jgi:hypothetical protein